MRENHNLNNFLKEDEFKILEHINSKFFNDIKLDFSFFTKKHINLIYSKIKIKSLCHWVFENEKNTDFLNLIEVLPFQNQSFIAFSSNFLSVIIDIIFGGKARLIDKCQKKYKTTSTELEINKKLINFIINSFSKIVKKFFYTDIKFTNIKIISDFKKPIFFSEEKFLINIFNFKLNGIEVYFSILIPLSIIKILIKKPSSFIEDNSNNCKKQTANISDSISIENLQDIKLNVTTKIYDFFISLEKFSSLSEGDILYIKNPNKVLGYLGKKPIFFGNYKRFNQQLVVFIEEFITIESNTNKDLNNHE